MSDIDGFKKIGDEWLEAVTKENADAQGTEAIMLVLRLGSLGQKLIYQAYTLGLDAALQALKEGQ